MNRQRGFTLIEIVITLLVSSILAIGIVGYIGDAIEGFAASGNRNQLASSGRVVADRLAMELHNALPGSLRVSAVQAGGDQCLEFVPFTGVTAYIDAPFTGSGGDEFEAIDFNPVQVLASPADVQAVIYPINTQALYDGGSPGPRALVDSIDDSDVADGKVTISLAATHRFSRRSPVNRVYMAGQPVSVCVVGQHLFRYSNYGYQAAQCTPATPSCLPAAAPDRQLVSLSINNTGLTAFGIISATLRRNAIVSMDFNFTDAGDEMRIRHEVLMRNVP